MNAALFCVSAAILTLQVLHMRILSVQMWYHHAYVVVTMAMLGFAVAGTVATIWPVDRARAAGRIAWCCVLFGVTTVLSHVLNATLTSGRITLASFLILLTPYFFGGMVITLILSISERLHFRYFVNLLGSALGAWLFILLVRPLGAEGLLILCGAIGPAAGLCVVGGAAASGARATLGVAVATIAACFAMIVLRPAFLDTQVAPEKAQHFGGEIIDQRWTPLSRLDLIADAPLDGDKPPKWVNIVQDGAAGTPMALAETWNGFREFDAHTVAYLPSLRRMREGGPAPSAAIIGLGGGLDVRYGVEAGARRVLGIEINEEMVRITGEDYADYNGGIYQLPGVQIVVDEGRSTLQRLGEKFDVITLAGADTYTAGAYGGFVLSESYLYTAEALGVYLDALKSGGAVGILRFYDIPSRETLRLFGMALLELRRRGAERPSRHVAVIRSDWSSGTVIAKRPMHPKDIEAFAAADTNGDPKTEVLYLPGLHKRKTNAFTRLAKAVEEGTEEEFYARYPVDVRGVTDDSPFFFNFHHLWHTDEVEDSAFARHFGVTIPIAPTILRGLLLKITLLVAALVVLPLLFLRRSGLRCEHAGRHLGLFMAVGAGFMFLEISAVQKLILFLGHPTYSLTVVLFSFLFFAGLGSVCAGRILRDAEGGLRKLAIVMPVAIVLLMVGFDLVLPRLLHLPLAGRIVTVIALLAPVNFVMGMPFPTALARLRAIQPNLLPWAIGANGGAGVMGSVLAVILAMEIGFRSVAVAAVIVYCSGLLAATTGPLRNATAASERSRQRR